MSDLDSRLMEAGEYWRDGLDADPSLEELFTTRLTSRRRWLPALAAAAIVVALAVSAFVVVHRSLTNQAAASGCADDFSAQPTRFVDGTAYIWLTYEGAGTCDIDSYGPLAQLTTTAGDQLSGYDSSLVEHAPYYPVSRGDIVMTWVGFRAPCTSGTLKGSSLELHLDSVHDPRTTGIEIPVEHPFSARCDSTGPASVAATSVFVRRAADTTQVSVHASYAFGPFPGLYVAYEPAVFTFRQQGSIETTAVSVKGRPVVLRLRPGTYVVHAVTSGPSCVDKRITVPRAGSLSVTVGCSSI